MKRIVLIILCLCILLLSVSCGNTTKDLLDESEYFVYENGEIFLDAKDTMKNGESSQLWFNQYPNEVLQTKRGLKIGSTVTQLKELYGDVTIFPNNKEITVSEYLAEKNNDNGIGIIIFMYRCNGETYGWKEFTQKHGKLVSLIDKAKTDEKYVDKAINELNNLPDIEYRELYIYIDKTKDSARISEIAVSYYSPEGFKKITTE